VPLPNNWRTQLSYGQLANLLANSTADEAGAIIRLLKQYGIPVPPVHAIGSPSSLALPTQSPSGGVARGEWLSLIRQGLGFAVSTVLAAGAGVVNGLRVFNPAASGKRGLIYQLIGSSLTAATEILVTSVGSDSGGWVAGPVGVRLSDGNATGIGLLTTMTKSPVAIEGTALQRTDITVNTPAVFQSPEGFVVELPEGTGVEIWNSTQNSALKATILYAEVPTGAYL